MRIGLELLIIGSMLISRYVDPFLEEAYITTAMFGFAMYGVYLAFHKISTNAARLGQDPPAEVPDIEAGVDALHAKQH